MAFAFVCDGEEEVLWQHEWLTDIQDTAYQ